MTAQYWSSWSSFKTFHPMTILIEHSVLGRLPLHPHFSAFIVRCHEHIPSRSSRYCSLDPNLSLSPFEESFFHPLANVSSPPLAKVPRKAIQVPEVQRL